MTGKMLKNNLKTKICLECYTEVDIDADVCPTCDCSFEGELLDMSWMEAEKEILKE